MVRLLIRAKSWGTSLIKSIKEQIFSHNEKFSIFLSSEPYKSGQIWDLVATANAQNMQQDGFCLAHVFLYKKNLRFCLYTGEHRSKKTRTLAYLHSVLLNHWNHFTSAKFSKFVNFYFNNFYLYNEIQTNSLELFQLLIFHQ